MGTFLISRIFASIVVLGGAASAVANGLDMAQNKKDLPFEVKCKVDTVKILENWASAFDWAELADDQGGKKYQSATQKVGIWTEIYKSSTGRITVSRVSRHTALTAFWNSEGCDAEMGWQVLPTPEYLASVKLFSDEKLEKLLQGKNGAILLWSAQMPYSLDAIKYMKAAAKKSKMLLTLVLDSRADQKSARSAAVKIGVKPSEIVINDSNELIRRDGELHFPTAFKYYNGRLSPTRLPGLNTEAGYENFLVGKSP